MVPDLVDEDMGDEVPKGLLVFGPVIEQGSSVEPDLIRHLAGGELAAMNSNGARADLLGKTRLLCHDNYGQSG